MKKTFIPISHRPKVKGGILKEGSDILSYTKNIKDFESLKKAIVLIGVYDDASQFKLVVNQIKNEPIAVLFFDDLGVNWNFSFYRKKLTFEINNFLILPVGIYYRGFGVQENHPKYYLFQNLHESIELWNGLVIGALAKHYYNSSKALQLTVTIQKSIQACQASVISFPTSFFLKGSTELLMNLIGEQGECIVKSCSYVRSQVVNSQDFMKWNHLSLQNLPTFFQKQIDGMDMRIHVIKNKVWGIIIKNKDGVDFRYAAKRSPYKKTKIPNYINKFTKILSGIEDLNLSGIDLIKSRENFYCLECNPSPGWSGFHRLSNDEQQIARLLIKRLKGRKKI